LLFWGFQNQFIPNTQMAEKDYWIKTPEDLRALPEVVLALLLRPHYREA
jgi:hypothetical protein